MTTIHHFKLQTIIGEPRNLADFDGKVVLLVNVASACGYTPQYAGLQALHEKYASRGLVVAGIPSNDFGAQEPGSDAEIKTFCSTKYAVTFPMFSKITVKGASKDSLYEWLTSESTPAGEVSWNFEKFLVGRDGKIAGRFKSAVEPQSAELIAAIEAALAVSVLYFGLTRAQTYIPSMSSENRR